MYTQRWRFHKILIFTATSRTFSVKLDSDAWEKKTITLELRGAFLVFPLQKTLTLWSYFSVRKLGVSRGNNSAQWLCPPRASSSGIWKLSAVLAHTHKRGLFLLSLWIFIYFCTFSCPLPVFCEHLYVPGRELHPNKTHWGKPPWSLLSWCWESKHWHQKSLNLTLTWCSNLLWNIINLLSF